MIAWLQGIDKTTRQRQTWYNNNQKNPQKKHRLGTVSKQWLQGLNMFKGTNLIFSSEVDQGIYGKVTKNTRKHNPQESYVMIVIHSGACPIRCFALNRT